MGKLDEAEYARAAAGGLTNTTTNFVGRNVISTKRNNVSLYIPTVLVLRGRNLIVALKELFNKQLISKSTRTN